jgi:hypothetical protein
MLPQTSYSPHISLSCIVRVGTSNLPILPDDTWITGYPEIDRVEADIAILILQATYLDTSKIPSGKHFHHALEYDTSQPCSLMTRRF